MEKSHLLPRSPMLCASENLHNASVEKEVRSGQPMTDRTSTILRWWDRLDAHYTALCETNTNRREYLLDVVGGKRSPKKYCILPEQTDAISKGTFDTFLSERTGVSAKTFQNTLFDTRYRPERETVKKLSQGLHLKEAQQQSFYNCFGHYFSANKPKEPAKTPADVVQQLKHKWEGASDLQIARYLGVSPNTVVYMTKRASVHQGTVYRALIVLCGEQEKDRQLQILHSFGLHPIENGYADGVSLICMGIYPNLILAMTEQYETDALTSASTEFWGILKSLLRNCDSRFHKNIHGIFFSKEFTELTGYELPDKNLRSQSNG